MKATENLGHVYACSRSAYASFMHAYAYIGMRTCAKVPKTMKCKFFYIKTKVWNESHII